MRCKTYEQAKQQAIANANSFGGAWMVFSDTSGGWNAEACPQGSSVSSLSTTGTRTIPPGAEIYCPDATDTPDTGFTKDQQARL